VLAEVTRISDGDRPELSLVVPCYNEQDNVRAMYEAMVAVAAPIVSSFEIIFIDNKSSDHTRELLREICGEDSRVRAIFNNRNYGQMRSPTYAIYQAKGRAVLALCCDFQDPPSLIPEMVAQWRAGAQIVLGQRRSEKTSVMLGLVRRTGYAFFKRFGDYPLFPARWSTSSRSGTSRSHSFAECWLRAATGWRSSPTIALSERPEAAATITVLCSTSHFPEWVVRQKGSFASSSSSRSTFACSPECLPSRPHSGSSSMATRRHYSF
jgi:hypothetical protein